MSATAAPAPLRRRHSFFIRAVVAIVIAIAVVAVVLGVWFLTTHLTISAGTAVTGGAAAFFTVRACETPVTVGTSSYWTCTLTASNSDPTGTHTVVGIAVSASFTEVAQYPGAPLDIGSFNSASIAVTVLTPSTGGSYNLVFTVQTSL